MVNFEISKLADNWNKINRQCYRKNHRTMEPNWSECHLIFLLHLLSPVCGVCLIFFPQRWWIISHPGCPGARSCRFASSGGRHFVANFLASLSIYLRSLAFIGPATWLYPVMANGFQLTAGESSSSSSVREYCHFETFRAECPSTDVVLMRSAFYGRKSLGRCVRTNFGFIGCYANVLEYMDRLCSGRRTCEVEVTEPRFEDIRPCNVELKSYLEADYTCLPVADAASAASPPGSLDALDCRLTIGPHHPTVLLRVGPSSSSCGAEAFPWSVRVPSGQRINITLFEFSSSSEPFVDGSVFEFDELDPLLAEDESAIRVCRPYGRVWETSLTGTDPSAGPVGICGGLTDRETHVLTTTTSSADVVFTVPSGRGFLLAFTVIGCPDVHTPSDMISHYSADRSKAKVTCKDSYQTWRLVCSDREWLGYIGNCSTRLAKSQAKSTEPLGHLKTNTAIVAAIVVGVSLSISFFILSIGLIVLKRVRGSSSASSYGDHIVMTYPGASSFHSGGGGGAQSSSVSSTSVPVAGPVTTADEDDDDRSSSPPTTTTATASSEYRPYDPVHSSPHHHNHRRRHNHPHPPSNRHHPLSRFRYSRPFVSTLSSTSAPLVEPSSPRRSFYSPSSDSDCPLVLLSISRGPCSKPAADWDRVAKGIPDEPPFIQTQSVLSGVGDGGDSGDQASPLTKAGHFGGADCSYSDAETELLAADRNCPDCVPCGVKPGLCYDL